MNVRSVAEKTRVLLPTVFRRLKQKPVSVVRDDEKVTYFIPRAQTGFCVGPSDARVECREDLQAVGDGGRTGKVDIRKEGTPGSR